MVRPIPPQSQKADPTFPGVTAHGLRQTAAPLAIHAGANPKVVQRMLGHAIAAMTLDVYADLFDSDLDTVAANVAKMRPTRGVGAQVYELKPLLPGPMSTSAINHLSVR